MVPVIRSAPVGDPDLALRSPGGRHPTEMWRRGAVSYQKISVNLSDEVLQELKEMAQRDNVTMTEVLRRSISNQKFLDDAQRSGKYVLLQDAATKETQRIVFR